MNSHMLLTVAAIGSISCAACTADNPAAPQDPGVGPTVLSVEPSASIVPDDPSGLVTLSVWPHEAGGQVSIELCADTNGRAIGAVFDRERTCEEQGGTWSVARDQAGTIWQSRTWPGHATLRFARTADQAPMLFRVTYEAPAGGVTRSVEACTWLLAESSDVGIACSSEQTSRALPWRLAGADASRGK